MKGAIQHSWAGYKERAWGNDNLNPVSGRGASGGFGVAITMVDSLDTLWLAGMREEFDEAVNWCKQNLPQRLGSLGGGVSAFETTIRALGGLVSQTPPPRPPTPNPVSDLRCHVDLTGGIPP